jgi:hypothetical protein
MAFRLAHEKAKQARRRRATNVITSDKFKLMGGLNFVDSAEGVTPGELISCRNYEPHFQTGAYRRIAGFERFSGRLRPHRAEYWRVGLTSISGGPFLLGETVGDGTETAIVVGYEIDVTSADDSGYMIITNLTNDVDAGATWVGVISSAEGTSSTRTEYEGEEDEDDHDAAQLLAEDFRRSFITKVGEGTCEGPVRGVKVYNDAVYAFRNVIGGAEGSMWKSTSTGWQRVALGFKVRFTDGSQQPNEGDSVVGASSGASCVIQRVVLTQGFWAGDDGVGYIVTTTITGGPFLTGEDLEIGGNKFAVTDTVIAQLPQTLPSGGVYRFRNYNFGGHTSTFRMYGANGVGNAFEFDGTVFASIETGMAFDQPTHIGVHRGQLLLAYTGGSLQHSGKNNPLSFQPVVGANEILAGDEITGFIEEVGDVSFVFTRNKTFRLEGFVQENIQLKLHNSETGAISDTMQRIGRSVYLDDRGFTQLPTTTSFGDFASAQISMKIDPLVQKFLANSQVEGSIINRSKSLYRCFFANKGAITIGFSGNRVNGITLIDYGLSITATDNGEMNNEEGNLVERTFVGDQDGWVYETDVGRNFDGQPLEAYFVTAYHFSGAPEKNKRYRRATLYITGEGRTTIRVSADYNYNEIASNYERIMDASVPLGGGRYGIDLHGDFVWSRASQGDIRVPMDSHARNVSLIVYHNEINEEPHICYAINYHISGRRIVRA